MTDTRPSACRARVQDGGSSRRRDGEGFAHEHRLHADRQQRRREMAASLGVPDEELLDALAIVGYDRDTIGLVDLAPLIEVAWGRRSRNRGATHPGCRRGLRTRRAEVPRDRTPAHGMARRQTPRSFFPNLALCGARSVWPLETRRGGRVLSPVWWRIASGSRPRHAPGSESDRRSRRASERRWITSPPHSGSPGPQCLTGARADTR